MDWISGKEMKRFFASYPFPINSLGCSIEAESTVFDCYIYAAGQRRIIRNTAINSQQRFNVTVFHFIHLRDTPLLVRQFFSSYSKWVLHSLGLSDLYIIIIFANPKIVDLNNINTNTMKARPFNSSYDATVCTTVIVLFTPLWYYITVLQSFRVNKYR